MLEELAAEYTKRLGLRVETVAPGEVTLTLPVTPELVHAGGVLCGQAILAAADTAMLLAMIAQLGEFRPMTTVQLQASFLRPVGKDDGNGRRRSRAFCATARACRMEKSSSRRETGSWRRMRRRRTRLL